MKMTSEQRNSALEKFSEYFVKNYPGPDTIIGDPNWHAPKIFRAALWAIESELSVPEITDDNYIRLKNAAEEVLNTYMPQFNDSRAVDDCLVGLAAAVVGVKTEDDLLV